jgi:hypothetical protein
MQVRKPMQDYAQSGLDIQYAMIDHARRFPDKKSRPDYILWSGLKITTGDCIKVPRTGIVQGEFISCHGDIEQGFDMDVKGWIELQDGTRVKRLRNWSDPRLEPKVECPYFSEDGSLWVWNVYKMRYRGGQVVEEKWTGNAGFWIEELGENVRVYHASHGAANPPDFESCVFKITIVGQ